MKRCLSTSASRYAPLIAVMLAVAMPAPACAVPIQPAAARLPAADSARQSLLAALSPMSPMSPMEVAAVTAVDKPRLAGGMGDAVLTLIDGIGQVPLAGPALVGLIAGVADMVGWFQDVADDRPVLDDSLAVPATANPHA